MNVEMAQLSKNVSSLCVCHEDILQQASLMSVTVNNVCVYGDMVQRASMM